DRDDRCCLLCSKDSRARLRNNRIDFDLHQFGRKLGESVCVPFPITKFDRDGATLDPTEFAQSLQESANSLALSRCSGSYDKPQARQLRRLLSARGLWPHRRAAEQREELPPPHSITSSASNWIELGTSRPSALAVCTLMTNSNLVDCRTGRSAGF